MMGLEEIKERNEEVTDNAVLRWALRQSWELASAGKSALFGPDGELKARDAFEEIMECAREALEETVQ